MMESKAARGVFVGLAVAGVLRDQELDRFPRARPDAAEKSVIRAHLVFAQGAQDVLLGGQEHADGPESEERIALVDEHIPREKLVRTEVEGP